MSPRNPKPVQRHYTRFDLADRIFDALRRAGADLDALTVDDLGPIDEFHIRGREATTELAELGALSPGTSVLDVGCGIGGAVAGAGGRLRVPRDRHRPGS